MPSRRPASVAVAPWVPMACSAKPCAGRRSGCPRRASSACSSSMIDRNPPNSSSGSSNPYAAGSAAPFGPSLYEAYSFEAYSFDTIDNLVYRFRQPSCPSYSSGVNVMSWFPEYTIESAAAGSRRFMVATQNHLGYLPTATARWAASPHLLEAFGRVSAIFENGTLDPVAREVVVMTIATRNS